MAHIHPTATVLELADRSKIKLDGVLDDLFVSIDSWECPTDFIVLQPKNYIGGDLLILGWPWLAISYSYIGCRSVDMYISHGHDRKKVTLYPPTRFIQEFRDTLWFDYDSSDEETRSLSLIHQYTESTMEGEIQDFLNKLNTMYNFESLHQIFSLCF